MGMRRALQVAAAAASTCREISNHGARSAGERDGTYRLACCVIPNVYCTMLLAAVVQAMLANSLHAYMCINTKCILL